MSLVNINSIASNIWFSTNSLIFLSREIDELDKSPRAPMAVKRKATTGWIHRHRHSDHLYS